MQEIIFLNICQKELFTSLPTGFGRFSELDESNNILFRTKFFGRKIK